MVRTRTRQRIASLLLAFVFAFGMAGFQGAHGAFAQNPPVHHKKNWVQRHPTLTAIGAGVATHHALKVSAKNAKAHGKRLNWAQRHPTLSAIGVGAVTRHEIKKHTPK